MKSVVVIIAVLLSLTITTEANAGCVTHKCWNRVHVAREINSVERKIDRITPYTCFGQQVVTPCWVIAQESAMCGLWTALNGCHQSSSRTPCDYRACGIYQLLGPEKHAPWPVIIAAASSTRIARLKAKYETLKRKLAHHRIAARLPMSAWGG